MSTAPQSRDANHGDGDERSTDHRAALSEACKSGRTGEVFKEQSTDGDPHGHTDSAENLRDEQEADGASLKPGTVDGGDGHVVSSGQTTRGAEAGTEATIPAIRSI